jgi:hypothetical protein
MVGKVKLFLSGLGGHERGADVDISFLTSALDGGERSNVCPGPRKRIPSTHSVRWVSPRGILGILIGKNSLDLFIQSRDGPGCIPPTVFCYHTSWPNVITREGKQCHILLRKVIVESQCE